MNRPSDADTEKQLASSVDSENSSQVSTAGLSGRFRWLVAPEKPTLLLPATAIWVFLLDWLLFSSNVLSIGLATPLVVVLGFVLGSVGTYRLQRRFAGDAPWKALTKAAIAGICVGMPWPVGGTVLGGWVLFVSGLSNAKSEILRK